MSPSPRIPHRRRPGRGLPDAGRTRAGGRADQRAAVGPRRGEDRLALLHRPGVRRPRRPGRHRRARPGPARSTSRAGATPRARRHRHLVDPRRHAVAGRPHLPDRRGRALDRDPGCRTRAGHLGQRGRVAPAHVPGRARRSCSTSSVSVRPRSRRTTSPAWPAPRCRTRQRPPAPPPGRPRPPRSRRRPTRPRSPASGGPSADSPRASC